MRGHRAGGLLRLAVRRPRRLDDAGPYQLAQPVFLSSEAVETKLVVVVAFDHSAKAKQ